ncbi:phage tail protein [Celerinatantimonas sp. YJH-8]|uniref:phage tail protein n=1 Tax=Celerinatantimonas sp. YJH-8 TaxID=3228714 RepID=UPI0038CBB9C1
MSTFLTILTQVGVAKLANATALGQTLSLTQLAVGDGNGAAVTPEPTQTGLVHEVRRAALNSVSIDPENPNWIICEQIIPPEVGGFTIREVGLFDDADDLIAVGNFPETYKPVLSEGSGRTQTIRMVLEVSSTESMELTLDSSIILATNEYVDQHIASLKKYSDQQDSDLKTYVDQQDANYQASAEADATTKANTAQQAAQNYAQQQDTSLKSYVDSQDVATLASANSYSDSAANTALSNAKTDATGKANAATQSAIDYWTQKLNQHGLNGAAQLYYGDMNSLFENGIYIVKAGEGATNTPYVEGGRDGICWVGGQGNNSYNTQLYINYNGGLFYRSGSINFDTNTVNFLEWKTVFSSENLLQVLDAELTELTSETLRLFSPVNIKTAIGRQFPGSSGNNSFQTFGHKILQTFVSTVPINGDSSASYSFPVQFPTGCNVVIPALMNATDKDDDVFPKVLNYNESQVTLRAESVAANEGSRFMMFIAIGE